MRSYSAIRRAQEGKRVIDKADFCMTKAENSGIVATSHIPLNRHTDEDILKACGNLYLAASLLTMKHIFRDIESLKPVIKRIVQLDRDRFLMVLQYVIMTKDIKEEELEEILRDSGGDIMPSLAQRWIDQGMQKGMVQDAWEMVLDALESRFGNYPGNLKERIVQMTDRDKLKEILRLILKIQDIEELEKAKIWN